jgi:hypothetical protein
LNRGLPIRSCIQRMLWPHSTRSWDIPMPTLQNDSCLWPNLIQFPESDKELLKEVVEECTVCEKFGPRPRRQRELIPANVVFNYEVDIDVYYIHGFPALSVVCSSTTYVASSFLESRKSSVIWDTFIRIWIMNYTGAPSVNNELYWCSVSCSA